MEKMAIRKKIKGYALIPLLVLILLCTSLLWTGGNPVYADADSVTINNEVYYYLTDVNYTYAFSHGGKFILSEDLYPEYTIICDPESGSLNLYLNGYSIYGDNLEDEPVIEVYADGTVTFEDSEKGHGYIGNSEHEAVTVMAGNLILRNVDICDSQIGIALSGGTVRVEGTSTISGTRIGIASVNSSVTVCGNTKIESNQCGICGDEAAEIYVEGNAGITGNNTAIQLSESAKLHLSGNVNIDDNLKNEVLVHDKQLVEIDPGSKMNVQFSIADYSNDTFEIWFVEANGRDPISAYVRAVPGYTSEYLNDSSISGNWVCISSGTCDVHSCEFSAGDYSISTKCTGCFSKTKTRLTVAGFDDEDSHAYYEGCNLSERIYITYEEGRNDRKSPYPTLVYGYFDTETGEESYSTKVPTEVGVYAVKLALLETENNLDTILADTTEHIFAIISEEEECSHDWGSYYEEYYGGRRVITARCDDCGRVVMRVDVNTNNTDISSRYENDGRKLLYLCQEDEITSECEGDEEYLEYLSFVYGYYKKDGSIKYSLDVPTEPGKYTVHLALLEDDNNPNSALVSTSQVLYEIQYHRWKYSSDITSLYAHCDCCGEDASVHLDSSGADYASRHYDDSSKEEYFDYDIFYQENWINQLGIDQFYVLYDGVAVEDEFNSTIKSNYFYKPTVSGNYTARLVLLKDVYNPGSAYQSTDAIQYHLSGYSIGNPYIKIVYYSEAQYAALDEPFCVDGVYQVDSFEDLMWVSRYCSDKDINITADIVVNPITVTDDGDTVRCGSSVIYKWLGLGNSYTEVYTGNIYGNGHIIYGLYSAGQTHTGLIAYGCNNTVKDLTISDSVLYAQSCAGGIIGYEVNKKEGSNASLTEISNCNVVNCSIKQSDSTAGVLKAAGGLIGKFNPDGASVLVLSNCVTDCSVNGYRAGGLVGVIENRLDLGTGRSLEISGCVSLGSVTADYEAGGLVGSSPTQLLCNITKSANAGNVEAHYYAGGLFGYLAYAEESGILTDCINIGKVSNSESNGAAGGLIGFAWNSKLNADNISYYGASNAIGHVEDSDTLSDIGTPTKLTKSNATLNYICSLIGCKESSRWSVVTMADCLQAGKTARVCLVCGKTVETREIASHGHNYGVEGKCVYCLEEESGDTGSVFSKTTKGLYIMLAVVVLAAAFVAVRKSKRQ